MTKIGEAPFAMFIEGCELTPVSFRKPDGGDDPGWMLQFSLVPPGSATGRATKSEPMALTDAGLRELLATLTDRVRQWDEFQSAGSGSASH